MIATSAEAFALQVAEQRIAELEAQLAEAQRDNAKLREFVATFDEWNESIGARDCWLAMLEKRAAAGDLP